MENFNDIGISGKFDLKRIEKLLKIGIFASILVFIGDWILGYGVCDESLTGLEGKLSQYKTLSDTTLFLSAFLGLIGIPLEGLCYFGIYRLMAERSPHYAHIYRSGILGYLIFGGCGVHVPCLAAVYVYNHIGYYEALIFIEYFLIPATVLFFIFFAVMSYAQIAAFAKGFTPLPKLCWIFSLPVGMAASMIFKLAGNLAFAHAVTAAWISIGNLWMFVGLLIMMKRVKENDTVKGSS